MAKPNKQHRARAASFKRIAKGLRTRSRNLVAKWRKTRYDDEDSNRLLTVAETLTHVAEEVEAEGKLLREMR